MDDEMDKLVDQVIKAEKLHALRRYRLHPVSLVPSAAAGSYRGWLGLRRRWAACAALALLSFTLLLVWRRGGEAPVAVTESRTIERALSAAGAAERGPLIAMASPSSDMAWTVQRALSRAQLLQYSSKDLGAVVSRAMANAQARHQPAGPSVSGIPRGLDQRLAELASSNAVGRVLSNLQP